MPRNRAVDYPAVHRPSALPQLGLAPPQQPWANDHARFSWQETPIEDEKQLGIETDEAQNRKSSVPPLPVLPEHLAAAATAAQQQRTLPSQQHPQFQTQQRPNGEQAQAQQARNFRPDIPRHLQQQQSPTPTYEASQAAYQYPEVKRQEQAVQLTARYSAFPPPAQTLPQAQPINPQQDSQEEKPPQQVQLKPVHVAPDTNPVSPTTPHSAISNTRTFPLSRTEEMHFTPASTPAHQTTKGGTWHHSTLSCADPTTCLPSLFCPCVIYGRSQYRLGLKSAKKDPTNMLGYSAINGSCVAWSVLCGVNILLTAIQHTRIRKMYDMEGQAGNLASDCVKSICCCCCVIAQDEKEMRLREKPVQIRTDEYKSPSAMTFGVN